MAPGECPGLFFLPGPPVIRAEMRRTEGRACHHEDPKAIDPFVPDINGIRDHARITVNRFNQNETFVSDTRGSKSKISRPDKKNFSVMSMRHQQSNIS